MIRPKYLSFIAIAVLAVGCQKGTSTGNNTNSNANTNVAAANANANSTPAANTATATDPGNAAGSPTEVYKAAYTARKNCDLAGLKKVMSKDLLKFLTEMGKTDKKSLDE